MSAGNVTQYRELFSIRCRHAYFANRTCGALQLSPTPQCRRLLDRYGCLFRANADGGSVYHGVRHADGRSLLRLFDETAPFAFALCGPLADLTQCTDMGAGQDGTSTSSLYYFANLQEQFATYDGEPCLLLHPPGKVFDGNPVPLRPRRFVQPLAQPANGAAVQLVDLLGNDMRKLPAPAQGARAIEIDCSGVPDGRYRLLIDGRPVDDFYIGDAVPLRWGIVDIFAGGPAMPGVPEPCRVIKADGSPAAAPQFTVALEPRQSYWRYIIVSQSAADRTYADCRIAGVSALRGSKGDGDAVVFTAPVRQPVNGRDAWFFESMTPIPLYEYPGDQHEFTLTKNGGGGAPLVLPYGRSGSTRLEPGPAGNGTRMVSEIYVYL